MGKEYVREQLSSPVKSGSSNVLVFDDFEGALSWEKDGVGSYTVEITNAAVLDGSYSLRLITQPTDPVVTDWVLARKRCTLAPSRYIRITLLWAPGSALPSGNSYFTFKYCFGSLLYTFSIKFDYANSTWQYQDSAGNWQNIDGSNVDILSGEPFRLQFVFDIMKLKYKSFSINSLLFDLTDIAIYITSITESTYAHFEVKIYPAADGTKGQCFLDNVLIEAINSL